MPIFDDPRKSLERMQRQLLQEEEEYEEEYLTEEEWLDEELAEAKALLGMSEDADEYEDLYRNFANGYGQYQQARQYEDFEEDEEEEEAKPKRCARGVRGQLTLTFVLLAGIVAVAAYWVAVFL